MRTQQRSIPPLLADQRAITGSTIFDNLLSHPAAVMASPRRGVGNPGLIQVQPEILARLPHGGGGREQAAAAYRTFAGLDTETDLALNHRLAQPTLGDVGCGLDSLDLQEGPQPINDLQELLAGDFRPGRWSLPP